MRSLFYVDSQIAQYLRTENYIGVLDQAQIAKQAIPKIRAHDPAAEFQDFATALETSVDTLIASAQAENIADAKTAWASIRSACAGCHRVYREE